ncbi:MAG: energy transducer TonB [Pseudomonadota bacterium]
MLAALKTPLTSAMGASILLHLFGLFGIGLVLPEPRNLSDMMQPLQVVLVNSKSTSKPAKADALAQANLDGGGNTPKDEQASTMLPNIRDDKQFTPEQIAERIAQLEIETQRMLSKIKSDYQIIQPEMEKQQSAAANSGDDLVQKSLEIARLEAQISKNNNYYQKLPRRKFIGARTQEYRFAQYIEDWRVKVERIGNLNYPEEARRQKIYGKLQLSVSIYANGTVEKVEVERSSGHRILDAAAIRIVKLAAPYSPLPPDITQDTDILTITRTWSFTPSDMLESE